MEIRKTIIFLLVLTIGALFSPVSIAGGYSSSAIPTQIDLVPGGGFRVYGNFGNPGGCSIADSFHMSTTHPHYEESYSLILAAYVSGRKVQVYVHDCIPLLWYTVATITYNNVTTGSISIVD